MKGLNSVDTGHDSVHPATKTECRCMVQYPGQDKVKFLDSASYPIGEAITAYKFVEAILEHRRDLFNAMWSIYRDEPATPGAAAELREADVIDSSGQLKALYRSVLKCGVAEPVPGVFGFEMIPPCEIATPDDDRWGAAEKQFRTNFVEVYSFLKKDGGPSR